jgi:hypothetical protein
VSKKSSKAGPKKVAVKVYDASPIKPSFRAARSTKAEMEQFRSDLLHIVFEMQPMTVRQVFYQATVRGFVDKSEAGYNKVQNNLVHMRRSGEMPAAIDDTADLYRKTAQLAAHKLFTKHMNGLKTTFPKWPETNPC